MAKIDFELDDSQMVALINRVRDRAPHVAARAINKSAKSAKTVLVRAVSKDIGIKQKDVRPALDLKDARPSRNPEARFRISKRRLTLARFVTPATIRKYSQPSPTKTPLKAKIGKLGRRSYPGAFVRTLSGNPQVVRRATYPGGPRLPIVVLRGPSLARVFLVHWPEGVRRFRDQLPKNINSELRFAARGR